MNKFQGPVNDDIYINLINSHPVVNGQMVIEIHVACEIHVAWGKKLMMPTWIFDRNDKIIDKITSIT
jgi:hypothetical protein